MRTSHLEAEFSQCCSILCQGREVSSCQQGALGAGPRPKAGRGREAPHLGGCMGVDRGLGVAQCSSPQGNDHLVLHSTKKTIQTMLMKCLGSCALVNSNLFYFFPPSHHCCAEFCSLLIHPLLSTVSQFFSVLLSLSTETEMKRGRRMFPFSSLVNHTSAPPTKMASLLSSTF